eukprot:1088020_1
MVPLFHLFLFLYSWYSFHGSAMVITLLSLSRITVDYQSDFKSVEGTCINAVRSRSGCDECGVWIPFNMDSSIAHCSCYIRLIACYALVMRHGRCDAAQKSFSFHFVMCSLHIESMTFDRVYLIPLLAFDWIYEPIYRIFVCKVFFFAVNIVPPILKTMV